MKHIAGVDIGGTKISVTIASKVGIKINLIQPTKLIGSNETIPKQADKLIEYACEQIRIKKNSIASVGVSTTSPFLKKGKYKVDIAPNLCGGLLKNSNIPNKWKYIPIEKSLLKKYKRVEIQNDGVAAVVAVKTFSTRKEENNLVYVTWSTGIGSGAIVDNRIITGKNGNAPHLGHIYIAEKGPQCRCGNRGDMESLCSGISIARDYGKNTETKDVFRNYNKDPKAKKIIDRAARNFARGLASMTTIVDNDLYVLGGSVFMNNKKILFPIIKDEFYKAFSILTKEVKFEPSDLDKYFGDIAALSLVMPEKWKKRWNKEKPWKNAPKPIVLDPDGNVER
ncbi:MAG: ROK family protein [Candidatus Woesearchaeota archaeon]